MAVLLPRPLLLLLFQLLLLLLAPLLFIQLLGLRSAFLLAQARIGL